MSMTSPTSTTTTSNPATSSHLFLDVGKMSPDLATARLIDHAVSTGSSDLFLVANETNVMAMVRHMGQLEQIGVLTSEQGRKCMAHAKATSGMDVSDKRRPADGRWLLRRGNGETVDLRINAIPTLYGEDLAIRLLTRGTRLHAIDNLGMGKDQLSRYAQMISSPSGLILITGPTGSGKTATLYASLLKLNDGKRKINTIEDPVEYAIPGLRQSQVNTAIDLGFGELLRGVLRQAPDVIMIGEIRDTETAQTAVHAANSGVLVFATLHAPTAAGAVQSMRSLGVHPHFLATSLLGVASQRLVRTLDPATRVAFDLTHSPGTFDEVKPWLGAGEGNALYAPGPAESNHMTGYSGRTGVFEVMQITKDIRQLIAENRPPKEIRDAAVEQGMLPFRLSTLLKVARGETSTEEVFRVIPSEQLLDDDGV